MYIWNNNFINVLHLVIRLRFTHILAKFWNKWIPIPYTGHNFRFHPDQHEQRMRTHNIWVHHRAVNLYNLQDHLLHLLRCDHEWKQRPAQDRHFVPCQLQVLLSAVPDQRCCFAICLLKAIPDGGQGLLPVRGCFIPCRHVLVFSAHFTDQFVDKCLLRINVLQHLRLFKLCFDLLNHCSLDWSLVFGWFPVYRFQWKLVC